MADIELKRTPTIFDELVDKDAVQTSLVEAHAERKWTKVLGGIAVGLASVSMLGGVGTYALHHVQEVLADLNTIGHNGG